MGNDKKKQSLKGLNCLRRDGNSVEEPQGYGPSVEKGSERFLRGGKRRASSREVALGNKKEDRTRRSTQKNMPFRDQGAPASEDSSLGVVKKKNPNR